MSRDQDRLQPVSSQLSLLCELVKAISTGVEGFGPQPTIAIRRTRRRKRRRRIDPEELIRNPTSPYATEYFAAPDEIVRP